MTRLTVTSTPAMGPLDVTVYSNHADPVEFALSSGDTQWSQTVAPGANTVVARRPDGSKLTQTVHVGDGENLVHLADLIPPALNTFMENETFRGLVTHLAEAKFPRSVSDWALPLGGGVNRALANAAYSVSDAPPSAPATSDLSFGAEATAAASGSVKFTFGRRLTLVAWRFQAGSWSPIAQLADQTDPGRGVATSPNFLKVFIKEPDPCVVGLLDEGGFGPLVVAPPFLDGVEVTFLAKAAYLRAADRRQLGNGARAPVALASPQDPPVSDLLAALAGASVDRAPDLWSQVSSPTAPTIHAVAQEMVQDKVAAPAEAILGAHFLLRFMPAELKVSWADNLAALLPDVADGPVIAAWARLTNASQSEAPDSVQGDVDRLVTEALSRPVTLFARTRSLLFDATHYVTADLPVSQMADLRLYKRFGSDAAGLESYWGYAPTSPGATGDRAPMVSLKDVVLQDGLFQP